MANRASGPFKYVQVGTVPKKDTSSYASIIDSRDRKGSSNAGMYPNKKYYAGPAGGAARFSWPIDTLKDAKDALRMRGKAPNPKGIERAVYELWPSLNK